MIKIFAILWTLQPSGDYTPQYAAEAPSMAVCERSVVDLMSDPSWPKDRVLTCESVTEV